MIGQHAPEPRQRVRRGNCDHTVVGLMRSMVGFAADPVIYTTLLDAPNIEVIERLAGRIAHQEPRSGDGHCVSIIQPVQ